MSSPAKSVDTVSELLSRLALRYGAAWDRLYASYDPDAVKADWADVLRGLTREAIAFGLSNLPPERPPNAMQFRAVCRGMPAKGEQLQLPKPMAQPAAVRARIAEILARNGRRSNAVPSPDETPQQREARVKAYAEQHGLSLDGRGLAGEVRS